MSPFVRASLWPALPRYRLRITMDVLSIVNKYFVQVNA
jgi:hypothetical protein